MTGPSREQLQQLKERAEREQQAAKKRADQAAAKQAEIAAKRAELEVTMNGETSGQVVERARTGGMKPRPLEGETAWHALQRRHHPDVEGTHDGSQGLISGSPEADFAKWLYNNGRIGKGDGKEPTDPE